MKVWNTRRLNSKSYRYTEGICCRLWHFLSVPDKGCRRFSATVMQCAAPEATSSKFRFKRGDTHFYNLTRCLVTDNEASQGRVFSPIDSTHVDSGFNGRPSCVLAFHGPWNPSHFQNRLWLGACGCHLAQDFIGPRWWSNSNSVGPSSGLSRDSWKWNARDEKTIRSVIQRDYCWLCRRVLCPSQGR